MRALYQCGELEVYIEVAMNPVEHAHIVHYPLITRNKSTTTKDNHKHKMVNEDQHTATNNNIKVLGEHKLFDSKINRNMNYIDKVNVNYHKYISNAKLEKLKQQENNANGKYHVVPKVPINMMPPPPHIISNNNVIIHSYNRNAYWKPRGDFQGNSPTESESDDSSQSLTPRSSPTNNGARPKVPRNSYSPCHDSYNTSNCYHYTAAHSYSDDHSRSNYSHKPRCFTNSGSVRHKRPNKKQPLDISRRVHGLMERFSSRSYLFRIGCNPYLMTGSPYDQLSQSIWDVYYAKAQKEKAYLQKLELWKTVYVHIRTILLRYGLFMVGSTMSGLGTERSDIDMCLLVKPYLNDARSDSLSYLQHIQNVLHNCDFVVHPEVILAKVPILKFRDPRYGFEIDLNCNNAVGIRNTHLMHCYAHLDWRVRPLVIIVKLWAQANDINDAKRMTISSYSLTLMVIHYLQCGVTPPAIPCLHGLYPDKFSPDSDIHSIDMQEELPSFFSDNKLSLGELFLGFLQYYSYFDYDQYAVSVREGTVLLKEECKYRRALKNDVTQWKLLCIEEPFDLTNTARSVYDVDTFTVIKNIFQMSYKLLNETKNLNMILNADVGQR